MAMSPWHDPLLPCSSDWVLGDWFDAVLCQLAPADVAACRLVSRAWRWQVSLTLYHLSAACSTSGAAGEGCKGGAEPAAGTIAVGAAFPRLQSLRLRLPAAAAPSDPPLPCPAPALGPLCRGLPLRSLALEAPSSRGPTRVLCQANLAQLAALAGSLTALSLSGFEVACGSGASGSSWGQLSRLHSLELTSCSLRWEERGLGVAGIGVSSSIEAAGVCEAPQPPGLLRALQPLAASLHSLALRERVVCDWESSPALVLAGPGAFAQLEALSLEGDFCLQPEAWAELVGLPRLRRLSFLRSPWAGHLFEEWALRDSSLAALAEAAAPRLEALALGGHALLGDGAVGCIARLTGLRELELRAGAIGPPLFGASRGLTDAGLALLSRLGVLHTLQLGGLELRDAACCAIGALGQLTLLELRACDSLDDEALHRLSSLRGLLNLSVVDCHRVTDIGVSCLMKQLTRLTALDLSGSYRNLSDSGAASIGGAPRLQRLSLAHCHNVTERGLATLLPRLRGLLHLSLRDCSQLSCQAAALVAASCPLLETLDLDYCRGVGAAGIGALGALRRLHTLRVHCAGAGEGALRALGERKAGRRLRIESQRPCWWLASEG